MRKRADTDLDEAVHRMERAVRKLGVVDRHKLVSDANEHLSWHDVVDRDESLSHILHSDLRRGLRDARRGRVDRPLIFFSKS